MLTAFQSQGHAQCTRNASAEQVKYVEPQEDRTILWSLSPLPFNFGYRCFGLYRYTLKKGTLSRVWHIPPGTPFILK